METHLDQAIRELIFKVYGVLYVGKLKINKLETGGYDLKLGLDCEEKPLHIIADLEFKDFLFFLIQELRSRHLHTTIYYTGYLILPDYHTPNHIHRVMNPIENTFHESLNIRQIIDEILTNLENKNNNIKYNIDWIGTLELFDKLSNVDKDKHYYIYDK